MVPQVGEQLLVRQQLLIEPFTILGIDRGGFVIRRVLLLSHATRINDDLAPNLAERAGIGPWSKPLKPVAGYQLAVGRQRPFVRKSRPVPAQHLA